MKSDVITNKKWDKSSDPFITVITPVYNRRETICRTIESVEKQTYRNIEYIIIDDGSTESIDDIVRNYMDRTKLPVMFIKKKNGGVHTARNIGYRQARGEMVLCIDSDDELMPSACEIFNKTWLSIPKEERNSYWQIKAQCVDQNGKMTAELFPNNVNDLPKEEARKFFSMAGGEQIGCRVADIMKKNNFPEPTGITFVAEGVVWIPLERKYKSWGINDIVRIYHKEGDNHLAGSWKKNNKQTIRNNLWSRAYMLNNKKDYGFNFLMYIKNIIKYCVFSHLLIRQGNGKFVKNNKLNGFANRFWKNVFWIPSLVYVFSMGRKGQSETKT